jgi:hypothetical protein
MSGSTMRQLGQDMMNIDRMLGRSLVRLPIVAIGSVLFAACGSRSPLSVEPGDDRIAIKDAGEEARLPRCFTDSRMIGEIPINLYFAMDKSLSMNMVDRGSSVSRWIAVSAAMNTLLTEPMSAGLGAGIGFFPRASGAGVLCTAADYAFPVVPVGMLPGTAPSITRAIAAQTLASGTPTTPALNGAHIYVRTEQAAHGDRIAAVVLVTDGAPRQCGSTVASTSAVAAAALTGSPPIKTYVLGVGPMLSNLNAIAQAGGTTQAYLVETGGEGALTAALEAIRTSALTCEYVLPERGGPMESFDVVNVTTTAGANGTQTVVRQVTTAESCNGGRGWFYDNPLAPDGPAPTKIILCPASCDSVVHQARSHLDVEIGCATSAPGP